MPASALLEAPLFSNVAGLGERGDPRAGEARGDVPGDDGLAVSFAERAAVEGDLGGPVRAPRGLRGDEELFAFGVSRRQGGAVFAVEILVRGGRVVLPGRVIEERWQGLGAVRLPPGLMADVNQGAHRAHAVNIAVFVGVFGGERGPRRRRLLGQREPLVVEL